MLGRQDRTRQRRIALLKALPKDSNSKIVAALDEFGAGGPSDSTVSKDITAMRKAGAIHRTRLDITAKGRTVLNEVML
ncbi:MAG: hypothetical protein H6835_05345 [Planctomycetes bacterium]|nr:hypothetical protein [Planctomycetota bacterium]